LRQSIADSWPHKL